jgi:hypothetical protein
MWLSATIQSFASASVKKIPAYPQTAGFVGHVNLEAAAAADQVDTIDALSSNISYIDHDCQGPNP